MIVEDIWLYCTLNNSISGIYCELARMVACVKGEEKDLYKISNHMPPLCTFRKKKPCCLEKRKNATVSVT